MILVLALYTLKKKTIMKLCVLLYQTIRRDVLLMVTAGLTGYYSGDPLGPPYRELALMTSSLLPPSRGVERT